LKAKLYSIATIIAVLLPVIGVACAITDLSLHGPDWFAISLMLSFYLASGFGITLGYHRYFTHRSFETVKPIRYLLAILGSMAVQGSIFFWVGTHRKHHQNSDQPGDPHSPYHRKSRTPSLLLGLWHAHVGWIFSQHPNQRASASADLAKDPILCVVDRFFLLWVGLGLFLPALIQGLATQSWHGFWQGWIWGGLARVFLTHHVTWSVNSVCHVFGARAYNTPDQSRNNWLVALPSLGEGWHNNHHAFPTSARHGLAPFQIDLTYGIILLLKSLGLAWAIKTPTSEALTATAQQAR